MRLAHRLDEIVPSATLAISAKAKAMQDQGIDVLSLSAGEPDFDTPAPVVAAGVAALESGFTRYTAVGGIPALIEAVRGKLLADNNLEYGPREILVSSGAKHSLFNAFMAVLDPGDEVLVPTPDWVSYPEMVRLAGGVPVFVPTTEDEDFLVTPEKLERYVTPRTRILVLNSPSNPTGGGYDERRLAALGEFALNRGLLIISDEIYEKLVYGGFRQISIASLSPELKASTLVVNGWSKTYAMTGWRLGYAAGPRLIIEAMTTIQSHSTSNTVSFAQKGGVAALALPPETVAGMVAEFERRRDFFVGRLRGMEKITCLMPVGAFYAFPKFSAYHGCTWEKGVITDSIGMAAYLLEKALVAGIPGSAFHADEHQRFSFAISMEALGRAADRIEEALAALR